MSGKHEAILPFRKIISYRRKQYCWIFGVGFLICFLAGMYLSGQGFLSSFFITSGFVSLLFFVSSFRHAQVMLQCLDVSGEDPGQKLEKYMEQNQHLWINLNETRIIAGTLLALAMIFSILFLKESNWPEILSAWFVCFILSIMLKGWMTFRDQILLHDIVRSLKN